MSMSPADGDQPCSRLRCWLRCPCRHLSLHAGGCRGPWPQPSWGAGVGQTRGAPTCPARGLCWWCGGGRRLAPTGPLSCVGFGGQGCAQPWLVGVTRPVGSITSQLPQSAHGIAC